MTIVVEDGTGIVDAESYVTVAFADAYWDARTHTDEYTTWTAGTTALKEGALREATAYLDSNWSSYYLGNRAGYLQGLHWPRTEAIDESGLPVPSLPLVLQHAACELAARAYSARLAADDARGGKIKSLKAGSVAIEYTEGATTKTSYGIVDDMLSPILNGMQPNGAPATWLWR